MASIQKGDARTRRALHKQSKLNYLDLVFSSCHFIVFSFVSLFHVCLVLVLFRVALCPVGWGRVASCLSVLFFRCNIMFEFQEDQQEKVSHEEACGIARVLHSVQDIEDCRAWLSQKRHLSTSERPLSIYVYARY